MFTVVTVVQSEPIATRATKLYRFLLKDGGVFRSEESLWQAALDTLPLDPPKSEPGKSLDALKDSLFGGFLGQGHRKVDLLWPYADHVSQDFLRFAVKFFQGVAESLHPDERAKNGEDGVLLHLYLVCLNEATSSDLSEALSSLK